MANTNNAAANGKSRKSLSLIILLAVLAVIVLWGVGVYNKLVPMQEKTEMAIGNIQTACQQRSDLIPNLVATVKSYAEYEQETLTAVMEARSKATSMNLDASNLTEENMQAFQAAQEQLSGSLSRLLVTFEKYPELKANQNYMDLHDKLEKCENTIALARKQFNESARDFNTQLRRFPNNIIAGMFGFDKVPYFEASEKAQEAPNVGDLFGTK